MQAARHLLGQPGYSDAGKMLDVSCAMTKLE